MQIQALNEQHILLTLPSGGDLLDLDHQIRHLLGNQVYDIIHAYDKLMVHVAPAPLSVMEMCKKIDQGLQLVKRQPVGVSDSLLEIPVWYDESVGIDLDAVCEKTKLSKSALIEQHTGQSYNVLAMGFAPGFAYLGALPQSLHIDRHENPRKSVAAGSVAIAADQTAVYPMASPGGWQIIGRTAMRLLDMNKEPISPFAIGQQVRFVSIDRKTFIEQGGDCS